MNYLKLTAVLFAFLAVFVLGLVPLAGALILSFLKLDVVESFTIIYGQWSWLGVRIVTLSLFILSLVVCAFND